MNRRLTSLYSENSQASNSASSLRRKPSIAFVSYANSTPRSSALASITVMYMIIFLMLGVVIPICDALAQPTEHQIFREVFYICIHGLGIVFMIYFNIMISFHKRKTRKIREKQEENVIFDLESRRSSLQPWAVDNKRSRKMSSNAEWQPLTSDGSYECSSFIQEAAAAQRPPVSTVTFQVVKENPYDQEMHETNDEVFNPDVVAKDAESPTSASKDTDDMDSDLTRNLYEDSGPSRLPEEVANAWKSGLRKNRRTVKLSQPSIPDQNDSASKTPKNVPDNLDLIYESREGVNLYLRLGAMIFGFGVMIHDGFKIVDVWGKDSLKCHGTLWIPKNMVHLLFVMVQNFHLFKHHRIVFNTHKPLVRIILAHMIITNLCIWMKTVVYEIKVALTKSLHETGAVVLLHSVSSSNSSVLPTANPTTSFLNDTLAEDDVLDCSHPDRLLSRVSYVLGPYLYPCAVEYGLICAAICYKIFERVGDTHVKALHFKTRSSAYFFSSCDKSHRGLFLGLIVMMVILVPLVTFLFMQSEWKTRDVYHIILVQCTEIFVLALCCVVSIVAVVSVSKNLSFASLKSKEAFDVNLLFVGLGGIYCYNLFIAIATASCLLDMHTSHTEHCADIGIVTKLSGLKSLLEVIESSCQTFMIMECMRRNVRTYKELFMKPGRGCIILLLIANLAMWIVSVFEWKKDISTTFLDNYFGTIPWNIVKHLFLPLIIFYRFHSSVCLSDLWSKIYKGSKIVDVSDGHESTD